MEGYWMRWLWIVMMVARLMNVEGGEVPLSKPGCRNKCGNVSIPYPFGVTPECSHNASFILTCNHSTKPPKPYLKLRGMGLQVVKISLDSETISVIQPIFPLMCSSNSSSTPLRTISLVGTPFNFFSSVAVVGCKSEVWLMDSSTNSQSPLGCRPSCGSTPTALGCFGINCCRISTTAAGPLQHLAMYYRTYEQGSHDHGRICGFAFLADSSWLRSQEYKTHYTSFLNRSHPLPTSSFHYVPMTLSWQYHGVLGHPGQGIECYNSTYSYSATLDNNITNSVNGSYCNCRFGFEGNPYLPGDQGCLDINECSNATLNNCTAGTTCVNTVGSFACHPYHNDQIKSVIIGITSGAGALLLVLGALLSSKLMRKRIKANRKKMYFKRNGGLLLQKQLSGCTNGGVDKIKLFTSKELALATDHYNENRILGRGGQGTVYKGMLPDGRIVAVKKSKKVEESDIEVFINEVVILSQINHRSIVKLLGCCLEAEVPILVYELIPNGTLFQHIHDHNDDYFPLSWKMRVRIATEVAGALSYLHNAASVPIYHRDIKSTNILLDDKYRAKISDFGTSRSIAIDQTHLTTRVLGTFGYLDPEYFQSSQFTEKSDVYSFGVVMVELLTGKKAISRVRAEEGVSLATHFLQSMEDNNLSDILDPEVLKEGRMEEIKAMAKLARRCLNLIGKRRPTMKAVAAELIGIQMMGDGPISPSKNNLEDMEFESVEITEEYDFPSTSGTNNSNVITSESPLLFGKS